MSDIPPHVRKRLVSASVFLAGAVALVVVGLVVRSWGPLDHQGPDPTAVPRVTVHAPGEGPAPPFPLEPHRTDEQARTVVQGEHVSHELRYTSPLPPVEVLALYPEHAAQAEAQHGATRVTLRWTDPQ